MPGRAGSRLCSASTRFPRRQTQRAVTAFYAKKLGAGWARRGAACHVSPAWWLRYCTAADVGWPSSSTAGARSRAATSKRCSLAS